MGRVMDKTTDKLILSYNYFNLFITIKHSLWMGNFEFSKKKKKKKKSKIISAFWRHKGKRVYVSKKIKLKAQYSLYYRFTNYIIYITLLHQNEKYASGLIGNKCELKPIRFHTDYVSWKIWQLLL